MDIDNRDECASLTSELEATRLERDRIRVSFEAVVDEWKRVVEERNALIEQVPTPQPEDVTGRGRILLNAYGRKCFTAGEVSATISAEQRWRPIATYAPGQGTEIERVLIWDEAVERTYLAYYEGGRWYTDDSTDCTAIRPTHWQPAPGRPEKTV